jgi:molybdenum cofactor cytidylyltransferase
MIEHEAQTETDSSKPGDAVLSEGDGNVDHAGIAAIVPAAGRSQRMGRPKLLLTIAGQSMLAHIVKSLRTGGAGRVVVVAPPSDSEEGPAVAAEARAVGAEVIVPPVRPLEMRDSIELALDQLAQGLPPSWVVLTPGDCPGITPALVAALLELAAQKQERIIVPVANGRRGHPIVLPWSMAAKIARLPCGVGVNTLLGEHSSELTELAVSNAAISADLDTPDDLRRWLDEEEARMMAGGESATSTTRPINQRQSQSVVSPQCIKLEVRFFAMAKDRAGRSAVDVELPVGARVADLRAEIGRRLPELAALLARSMIAVNEEYAADDFVLTDAARVAVIPPVSGGSFAGESGGCPAPDRFLPRTRRSASGG